MSRGNQHYPYEFPGVLVTSTYSFDVDERWRIGYTGGKVNLASPFGTLVRSQRRNGDHGVVFESRLHLPARRIEVGELPDFNRFLEMLKRESRMRIVAELR